MRAGMLSEEIGPENCRLSSVISALPGWFAAVVTVDADLQGDTLPRPPTTCAI